MTLSPLVVDLDLVIFLMLSTTYSKFTEMQVTLPAADVDKQRDYPREIIVAVSSEGRYMVNKVSVDGGSAERLGAALALAATGGKESTVIISADAKASHQAVISVMEAARRQGLNQITFATQRSQSAGSR